MSRVYKNKIEYIDNRIKELQTEKEKLEKDHKETEERLKKVYV